MTVVCESAHAGDVVRRMINVDRSNRRRESVRDRRGKQLDERLTRLRRIGEICLQRRVGENFQLRDDCASIGRYAATRVRSRGRNGKDCVNGAIGHGEQERGPRLRPRHTGCHCLSLCG